MAGVRRTVGANYDFNWNGDGVMYTVLEATRRAINDTTDAAVGLALEHPAWDNDSGQTEAAVYKKPAEIEIYGSSADPEPHVWGEWGVESRIREEQVYFAPSPTYSRQFIDSGQPPPEPGLLTTVDVALFGVWNRTSGASSLALSGLGCNKALACTSREILFRRNQRKWYADCDSFATGTVYAPFLRRKMCGARVREILGRRDHLKIGASNGI